MEKKKYMKTRGLTGRIEQLSLIALIILLAAGCQQDDEVPGAGRQRTPMEVIPMYSSFLDVQPWTTRAGGTLPTGYVPWNNLYPTTTPDHTTIGVWMTPERTTPVEDFIYKGTDPATSLPTNDWKSSIIVTEGQQYYIYGFMPREDAESASISPVDASGNVTASAADYVNGAKISINNFNTLTAADVCVIVGARLATANEKISGELDSNVELGKFDYMGQPEGENRVFVLLKHIYSGLHFKMTIDAKYHELRTIKVTRVELDALNTKSKINLSVTLLANTTATDPMTDVQYPAVTESGSTASAVLFPYAGSKTEIELPVSTPQDLLACSAPGMCDEYVLRTTYDVYDRKGNMIRQGETAENSFKLTTLKPEFAITPLRAGEVFAINVNVKPTYLYVLSDPDLNNPTFVIN